MDSSGSAGPTAEEKLRFLKKIEEWRQLGFKTDELEYLLDHDFNEFLKKRHELLKFQVEHDKDLESALLATGPPLVMCLHPRFRTDIHSAAIPGLRSPKATKTPFSSQHLLPNIKRAGAFRGAFASGILPYVIGWVNDTVSGRGNPVKTKGAVFS